MFFRKENVAVRGEQAAARGMPLFPHGFTITSWVPGGSRSNHTPRASMPAIRAEPCDFLRVRLLPVVQARRIGARRSDHVGPLPEKRRLQTALARKLGACDNCRLRKVKASKTTSFVCLVLATDCFLIVQSHQPRSFRGCLQRAPNSGFAEGGLLQVHLCRPNPRDAGNI
jgi:hypothetical protein